VLLADDPGLGKSLQALAAADDLAAERILIVSPAGVRMVWQREIHRWFSAWAKRIVLVQPGEPPPTKVQLAAWDAIVLVSYDALSDHDNPLIAQLAKLRWDLLVLDEAHYLKNKSNRTLAVYGDHGSDQGIQASAAQIILLSGTIAPNHCGELYQHVRTLWPETILKVALSRTSSQPVARPLSLPEFEERYTRYKDTPWGRQVVGSNRQAELRDKLRSVVLRRTKDQVLPELPPLQVQDIPLTDLDPTVFQASLGDQARTLHRALYRTTQHAGDDAVMRALQQVNTTADNNLAALRRQLGELKVPAIVAWVEERLACGIGKLILFGWHLGVLNQLHRLLAAYDPVLVTGETTPTGRVTAIDLFQHRPSVRLFIGQILAAGTGITLTAAHEVAIVEPSWVPAENVQAICRAHRLGQHDSVLASFLYAPGTLDETIMRVFRRKAQELGHLDFTQANSGEFSGDVAQRADKFHLQRQSAD
jgi:SWI/SNF-related matrix-associated actin-dependent regulator 1 of chromatin subfamily A